MTLEVLFSDHLCFPLGISQRQRHYAESRRLFQSESTKSVPKRQPSEAYPTRFQTWAIMVSFDPQAAQ